MTEGLVQQTFNSFRSKRLGKSITHEETLHLEQELIKRIKLAADYNGEVWTPRLIGMAFYRGDKIE